MVYTKPIREISWDDVNAFCQERIPEGAYLDYKEDFPRHLEKTISAMANTFGGLILLGVEEDEENRPVLPIKGIEFRRGLSERVISVILTNIVPPVFPEVAVCRDPSGQRAVVVIRIPQSHQAPHAIADNTRVYLRTGNLNNPERLATIDEIGWLSENRAKSVALRQALYDRVESHYSSFRSRVADRLLSQGQDRDDGEGTRDLLTLSICPTYPKDSYGTPPELLGIREKICVGDYYGPFGRYGFPPPQRLGRIEPATIVQDGVVLVNCDGPRLFYTEINSFGLYFYRQSVDRMRAEVMGGIRKEALRAGELFSRIDEFLDSAKRLYDEIGYWGYLDLKIHLVGIRESCLYLDWLGWHPDLGLAHGAPHGYSPDEEMLFTETLLVRSLETEKDQLFLRSAQRIAWAFGVDLTPEKLRQSRWPWPIRAPDD